MAKYRRALLIPSYNPRPFGMEAESTYMHTNYKAGNAWSSPIFDTIPPWLSRVFVLAPFLTNASIVFIRQNVL